jgi:uncharacterized protein (TIGR02996 family)
MLSGMDTEAAFMSAMAADPDNNLPRLVFADWLEENGDADRAEFIRLQCDPTADDAMTARAEELLAANRDRWEVPIAAFGREIESRRGFSHFLKADFQRVVEQQEMLALAPDWHLSLTREDWEYDEPQVELCERFAEGPHLDRIRGLNLAWAGWEPEELEALFAPPLVARLRELRFGDSGGEEEFAVLEPHANLRLEALGFGGDSYGIGDDGLSRIAEDARFASLLTLELPNCGLTAEGIFQLARSPHVKQLRDLELTGGSNSSNEIGADGAEAIANSANFRHLEHLALAYNNIADDGFHELVWSPHLPNLRAINAPGNGITDEGLFSLAESDELPNLNWLNLCGEQGITVEGVRALLKSERMPRMKTVRFSEARLGDEAAELFADSPACRNLTELYLGSCGISISGYTRLLESPHLVGVKLFELAHTGLTRDQILKLRERFGSRVEEPPDYLR